MHKTRFVNLLFILMPSLCGFEIQAQSLSIISWNIQDFGQTKDESEIRIIAEILRDFDVVAIQEVVAGRGGVKAVTRLVDELNRMGSRWDFRVSNPTKSPKYKTERYAYLWKTSKVKLVGRPFLASEYAEKIFREPYLARFQFDGKSILLVNYHARRFDEKPEEEAAFLPEFHMKYFEDIVFFLGDFNLKENHKVFNALEFFGYAPTVQKQKTTLKRKCDRFGNYLNYNIDNIYYPFEKSRMVSTGVKDFVRGCEFLKEDRFISDHLGVYLEFEWIE